MQHGLVGLVGDGAEDGGLAFARRVEQAQGLIAVAGQEDRVVVHSAILQAELDMVVETLDAAHRGIEPDARGEGRNERLDVAA